MKQEVTKVEYDELSGRLSEFAQYLFGENDALKIRWIVATKELLNESGQAKPHATDRCSVCGRRTTEPQKYNACEGHHK